VILLWYRFILSPLELMNLERHTEHRNIEDVAFGMLVGGMMIQVVAW